MGVSMKIPRLPFSKDMEVQGSTDDGQSTAFGHFEAKIRGELEIDRAELDQELLEQPGKQAWYSAMEGALEAKLKALDRQAKKLYAELYIGLKVNPPEEWGKRPTNDMIDSAIKTNERYDKLTAKMAWVEEALGLIRGATKGFHDRRECLLELSRRERVRLSQDAPMRDKEGRFDPGMYRRTRQTQHTED